MKTRLWIQFAEQDKLGDIIDLIRAACTIGPDNPASVPVDHDDKQYYFSLNVDISFDQMKAALANGTTDLGPKADQAVGFSNMQCLYKVDDIYQVWHIDVKFADRKLIAYPLGIALNTFEAR